MIKMEFLTLLNDEIERLEREYNLANTRVNIYIKTNATEDDINKARFMALSAQKKLDEVKKVLYVPIIARVEGASDAEVQAYRQWKINTYKLQILELKNTINSIKREISSKTKEREEKIDKYGSIDEENASKKRRELEAEIWSIQNEINIEEEHLTHCEEDLEQKKDELESFRKQTIDDIKKERLSKIDRISDRMKRKNEFDNRPKIPKAIELLASVAFDFDKAKKMIELLDEYNELTGEKSRINVKVYIPESISLPKGFCEGIKSNWWVGIKDSYREIGVRDPVSFLNYTIKEKRKYYEELEFYNEHFTKEKLEMLPKYLRDNWDGNTFYDMLPQIISFLEKHLDKIPEEEIKAFKENAEKAKELERKIFKTREIKRESLDLLLGMHRDYKHYIKTIYKWYCDNADKVIDITRVKFNDLNYLGIIHSIVEGDAEDIIRDQERAIGSLQTSLERAKEEIKDRGILFAPRMKYLREQMIELAGSKFADTDFTPIAKNYKDKSGEDTLADVKARLYKEQLADKIYSEVRKDADKDEATVTGKTIEQLMKERRRELEKVKDAEKDYAFKNNPANVSYETEVSDKIQDVIDEIKNPVIRKRKM